MKTSKGIWVKIRPLVFAVLGLAALVAIPTYVSFSLLKYEVNDSYKMQPAVCNTECVQLRDQDLRRSI
jgi:hypothetical protein